LRRAMGKKKPAEMAKQRSVFLQGAAERGVAPALATRIFDLMEKFAEYGFNRSHSAAYALLAYQTAWLKAHHPAAFMAAVLTCEMDDTDKLVVMKRECESLGLQIERPDVNSSGYAFEVSGARSIRYGLGAIKGLGQAAAEHLCERRQAGGEYCDLFELCRRLDIQRLGRRAMEALIKAGALDALGPNRPSLLATLPAALGAAEQAARSRDSGQDDLFGVGSGVQASADQVVIAVGDWGPAQRLAAERESLGLYLSGHPFDQYRADAACFASGSVSALLNSPPPPPGAEYQPGREVSVAGLVTNLRKRTGRITVEIDDGSGVLEASIFPETYERCRNHLGNHAIVVVTGQLRWDAFIDGWRIAARDVAAIDDVIEKHASRLLIRWSDRPGSRLDARALRNTLEPFRPGGCGVLLHYTGRDAQARLVLGEEWTVRPSLELRERLSALVGADGFRFVYDVAPSLH
ncbi:MAG: OB-fold nucleic acid binding domain-containing protein, partial [Gammaproteobacteria bacterium]|nr:OB-fold nucleic acid binding domain-containing protein [Gammaproteobacteria bacterium]